MHSSWVFFLFPFIVRNVLEGQPLIAGKSATIHCHFLLSWSPLSQFWFPPGLLHVLLLSEVSAHVSAVMLGGWQWKSQASPKACKSPTAPICPASFCSLEQRCVSRRRRNLCVPQVESRGYWIVAPDPYRLSSRGGNNRPSYAYVNSRSCCFSPSHLQNGWLTREARLPHVLRASGWLPWDWGHLAGAGQRQARAAAWRGHPGPVAAPAVPRTHFSPCSGPLAARGFLGGYSGR